MIKVNDTVENLDLAKIIGFSSQLEQEIEWTIFDLEYSGETYGDKFPVELEKESLLGVKFSTEEINSFEKTVNQIIEATIIAVSSISDSALVSCDEELLKLVIYDGAIWEVGGALSEKFIQTMGLKIIENY